MVKIRDGLIDGTQIRTETPGLKASVKVSDLNIPNPYFSKVDAMVDLPEIQQILDMIDGDMDEMEAYLALVDNEEVGSLLDKILDKWEDTAFVDPTMPPAPQSQKLYTRFAEHSSVADIGSGDGKKASNCVAGIKCYDKEPLSDFVKKLDLDVEPLPPSQLYSSYNALTQLNNLEVLERDGIHIFPDVDYLKNEMGVTSENGKIVTRVGDKVFVDLDRDLQGDVLSEGYRIRMSYQARDINLRKGAPIKTKEFTGTITDVATQLAGEATPKYDGVCMRLDFTSAGNASLYTRKGLGYTLLDDVSGEICGKCGYTSEEGCGNQNCARYQADSKLVDRPVTMKLELEKLPKVGKPECFVLLRVFEYNGMLPYHGLDGLRQFCKNINLRIMGCPVYAPGSPELLNYDVDGVIFRSDEKDYRLKKVMSLDLVDPDVFRDDARDLGYDVRVVGGSGYRGVKEYAVWVNRDRYILKYVRDRHDKTTETEYNVEFVLARANKVADQEQWGQPYKIK